MTALTSALGAPAPRQRLAWAAVAALVLALALGQALLAYSASPALVLALAASIGVVLVVIARPWLGVCAALLAIPAEYLDVRVGAGTAALSPSEALLVLSAAAIAIHFLGSGTLGPLHPAHMAFVGILVVVALGVGFAADTFVVLRILVMWTAFLVVSLRVAHSTARERRLLLGCLALAGGVVGALAVAGGTNQELVAGGTVVENRAVAGFAHPNVLGAFAVLVIPPALAMSARGPVWLRLAMGSCAALALAGLVVSQSRGAIVGTIVALVVLLAWPGFRRAVVVVIAVLALFVGLNSDSIFKSPEVQLVHTRLGTITSKRETTANPRIRLWELTPRMIVQHPFVGVGAGNFPLASPPFGLRDVGGLPFEHAHNIALTFAAELGLLGLALLVWLVVAVARSSARVLSARAGPEFPAALAASAALAGLFAHGLTDYPLRTNVIMAVALVLVGLLVAYERERCGLRSR